MITSFTALSVLIFTKNTLGRLDELQNQGTTSDDARTARQEIPASRNKNETQEKQRGVNLHSKETHLPTKFSKTELFPAL